jgi:hypothetical protein
MELTLYQNLKLFDRINIRENGEIICGPEMTEFVERRTIEDFQKWGNETLTAALEGRQTIEGTLEELSQGLTGINMWLPHRRDEEHNKRVKELGELIAEPKYLLKKGVLIPDNPISIIPYAAALSVAAGFGVVAMFGGFGPNSVMMREDINFFTHTFPLYMTPFLMVVPFCTMWRIFGKPDSAVQARYLDAKISQYYPLKTK